VTGQPRAAAGGHEITDVGDPQRERLRVAASALEQIGADQPVFAELIRLADRLGAHPELVRVRGARSDRERDRSDHHPACAHRPRRYHVTVRA